MTATATLSPGTRLDLTGRQGATWLLPLTWTAGTPAGAVNLTGATARLQVRRAYADDDPGSPVLEATEVDGLTLGGIAGTVEWRAEAAATEAIPYGAYVWELRIWIVSGDTVKLLTGSLLVTPGTDREVAA